MNWEKVPIGALFETQLGKMLDKEKNRGEPRPYIANRNVRWDRVDLSDLPQMRFTEDDREKFALRSGDLLVCEGGEVGRTAVWDGPPGVYYQKAVHRLRAKEPVEPRYVMHYMRWAAQRNEFARLTNSTSIAHLTQTKLRKLRIPLPPLQEQNRIAAILDTADAIRNKRRESLDQLDELVQSVFIDVFGDPVTNSQGWEIDTLKNCSQGIVDGPFGSNLKTVDYVDSGIPVLQGKNITGDRFKWFDVRYVTPEKAEKLKRSEVREGDHLLIKIGSIGYTAVLDSLRGHEFAIIPANMMRVRRDPSRVTEQYLHTLLRTPGMVQRIQGLASKTAQPALSLKKIRSLEIPVPPLQVQEQFEEIVESVEALRGAAEYHAEELDTLFASLQSRAFSGEL